MEKICLLFFSVFFGATAFVNAQNITVTGTVTYDGSEPILGVNIIEKNTSNGVVSDFDGKFTISVNNPNATLVFSFVGLKSKELTLEGQTQVDVILEEDASRLDEIVVIGYGTSTRRDLTGSVGSINIENSPIANIANVNALDAMKGKVAGLNIGNVTSAGGQPSIQIRGQNSLSAGNSPLLVVDGLIYDGGFSTINPNDISTIDVLKDASAAAVYGSRSANGVVIITTKRGKSGKPQINVSTYSGIQNWTNKPDMMNAEQALQFRQDVYRSGGTTGSDLDFSRILGQKEYQAYQEGHSVDWFDEVTRAASIQSLQLSVSGAGDNVNYYVSGNLLDQTGIVKGDDFSKRSVLMKLDTDVSKWLKIGTSLNADIRDYSGNSADLYTATYMSPFGYKNVQELGFENWMEKYPGGITTWSNPLSATQNYNLDKRYTYRGTVFAEVKIPWIDGLKYRFNYSANRYHGESEGFTDEKYYVNTLKIEELNNPGKYLKNANGYKNNSTEDSYLFNNILSYNKTLFNDHNINATLMSERQERVSKYSNLSASDFEEVGSTALGVNSLELGNSEKRNVNTGYSKLTQLAYLFRLNYNYKNKYYGTFSYRRDGYSGFAPGNKFGDFKAFGLAWTLSEESFIKDNIKFIDNLKLRLSYGENGNPSIGSYGTLPNVGNSSYVFGDQTVNTAYQSNLSNQNLKWEQTNATNLGLDFSILKDRISGSVEVYDSKTTNLLMTRRLPIMTGYGSILANIGEINNKGLEISLTTVNIKNQDFTWETNFTYWKNKNKIVSLYGIDADGDGVEDDDLSNGWFIGKSLGAIYDYTFDGIVQTEDTEYQQTYSARPGDVKFKDISGPDGVPDGRITSDDRSIIGYSKPNFSLNMANTFTYKNLNLYFNFNYVDGGNNHYLAGNTKGLMGALVPNASKWLNLPYWTPERQGNTYPRPDYSNTYGYGFYQSHSFLRLQDVTLGYTFDKDWIEKSNIGNLKVYISGKNLLTISDWIGWDPESATQIGEYSLPGLSSLTLGIDLTF
ncbi:SusC/RagA family TonB-linked outer membrane protein [Gelidibacter mesophilus]|uniref:SusC/RagA family TonB-linked outer membrane protein n=1 Tax=Gelidibacter mesophilus TaxID=169050 RepID=UPI000419123B|nr:TonB-dependent receptor [Gelidibacter mesophilus]